MSTGSSGTNPTFGAIVIPLIRACEEIGQSSGAGVSPVFRRSREPSVSAAVRVGGGQDARPTHQFLHALESANPQALVQTQFGKVQRQSLIVAG
jgi:hypothetical protein